MQEHFSQSCAFSTLVSPMGGTIVQLSIVEILGIPDSTNFLPVEATGTLIFCSFAAIVIHIFSVGKLNSLVEVKFEDCCKEPEQSFINCYTGASKTTDPVVCSEVKLLNLCQQQNVWESKSHSNSQHIVIFIQLSEIQTLM